MSHITTATCQSVALESLTLVVTSYIRRRLAQLRFANTILYFFKSFHWKLKLLCVVRLQFFCLWSREDIATCGNASGLQLCALSALVEGQKFNMSTYLNLVPRARISWPREKCEWLWDNPFEITRFRWFWDMRSQYLVPRPSRGLFIYNW